ncbi:MAG TPA: spore germination protein GerW family protein [Limnochordales bacterium]
MNVEVILDKVVSTLNTRTVVGEPLEFQGVTLVPIVDIAFGFGAGGGEAPGGQGGSGCGSGGGGGGRMKVAGVVVIKDGDVRFLPTSTGGTLDKLLDAVPDLLQKVKAKADRCRQGERDDD